MSIIDCVLSVFPERLSCAVKKAFLTAHGVYEIRLVGQRTVYFYGESGIRFISCDGSATKYPPKNPLVPTTEELCEITQRALGYSGFMRESELFGGYISYGGGIRIGLSCDGEGSAMGKGKITSLCVRIPYVSENLTSLVREELLGFDTGLLIAGPPASGKTTLLKGISSYLSDGLGGGFCKVCVVDQRDELFTDKLKGTTIDVIRGKDKAAAIAHAVRVMSPQYIICDEIGSERESESLLEGLNSGVRFICSMHAPGLAGLIRRPQFRRLFSGNVFDRVVVLSSLRPGEIEEIYDYGEVACEIGRTCGDIRGNSTFGDIYFRPQAQTVSASFSDSGVFF